MSLDNATVRKIAALARIEIPEEDLAGWAAQLTGILGWIEQLNEVDTSKVAPMSGGTDIKLALRADVVSDGGIADHVLANAPESDGGFFVVPKVVE